MLTWHLSLASLAAPDWLVWHMLIAELIGPKGQDGWGLSHLTCSWLHSSYDFFVFYINRKYHPIISSIGRYFWIFCGFQFPRHYVILSGWNHETGQVWSNIEEKQTKYFILLFYWSKTSQLYLKEKLRKKYLI